MNQHFRRRILCGTDHRPKAAEIIRKADALPAAPGLLATKGTDQ